MILKIRYSFLVKKLSENRVEIFSKIGCLIEQPSLYEHISGYDNLEITRKIRQVNKNRVADVLSLVKLSTAAHKKVKAYSLGMKQKKVTEMKVQE